jgi:hypothetical protein
MFNLNDQINNRAALTLDEQSSLIAQLKEHLKDPDTRENAIALLKQLRKRDDLYARISREIYNVLQTVDSEQAPDQPIVPLEVLPVAEPESVQSQSDSAPPSEPDEPESIQSDQPIMRFDVLPIAETEVVQTQPDSAPPSEPDQPVIASNEAISPETDETWTKRMMTALRGLTKRNSED